MKNLLLVFVIPFFMFSCDQVSELCAEIKTSEISAALGPNVGIDQVLLEINGERKAIQKSPDNDLCSSAYATKFSTALGTYNYVILDVNNNILNAGRIEVTEDCQPLLIQ